MYLKKNRSGIYYICERVKKEGKWTQRYLASLGKITKEEAEKALSLWQKRVQINPIYRTIVIDPPWEMKKSKRTARPKQVDMDYKVMPLEEIKHFPLRKFVSADGCHVYLWTTHKHLPDAFAVFKAWGVKYVFNMVWHKAGGFQPFDLPQYNCEFVLFGHIGNLKFSTTKRFSCCFYGKRGGHSEKPGEFYETIERVSPGPRVDIFARKRRNGWGVYGYEV